MHSPVAFRVQVIDHFQMFLSILPYNHTKASVVMDQDLKNSVHFELFKRFDIRIP